MRARAKLLEWRGKPTVKGRVAQELMALAPMPLGYEDLVDSSGGSLGQVQHAVGALRREGLVERFVEREGRLQVVWFRWIGA